jgi:hypothetical protein
MASSQQGHQLGVPPSLLVYLRLFSGGLLLPNACFSRRQALFCAPQASKGVRVSGPSRRAQRQSIDAPMRTTADR